MLQFPAVKKLPKSNLIAGAIALAVVLVLLIWLLASGDPSTPFVAPVE